jgi:RIO-like serine/threonine protein kinase
VLTDEGSAGMATSFVDIDCRIDFNNIILEISSSSIEELIKKDKSRLIEFFRKHLQNESVSIETQMIENTTKKNIKSLSPKERLNEMINQNPEVLRLMKDLGLELDY